MSRNCLMVGHSPMMRTPLNGFSALTRTLLKFSATERWTPANLSNQLFPRPRPQGIVTVTGRSSLERNALYAQSCGLVSATSTRRAIGLLGVRHPNHDLDGAGLALVLGLHVVVVLATHQQGAIEVSHRSSVVVAVVDDLNSRASVLVVPNRNRDRGLLHSFGGDIDGPHHGGLGSVYRVIV